MLFDAQLAIYIKTIVVNMEETNTSAMGDR